MDSDEKLLLSLRFEWESSGRKDVQDDSKGPNVCLEPVVVCFADNLRGHVRRRSTEHFEVLISPYAEAKVNDFDLLAIRDKNILKFEIPVANQLPMHRLDGLYDLLEVKLGILLGEPTFLPFGPQELE